MNALLFLIITSASIGTITSDTINFKIENRQIVWQKVYETKFTKEQLNSMITSSGMFKNITETQQGWTANIEELSLDFQGVGESEMNVPMYIPRSYVKAFAVIEFKEDRYRVTIKSIKLMQKYDDPLSKQGEITDLELYALKKKEVEFSNNFLKKPIKIFNFTFDKIASLGTAKGEDKW